jgi:hypothetical protein
MHQERREGLAEMVAKLRERHPDDDPASPPASNRWVDEVLGAQSDLAVMHALREMREALSAAYAEAMHSPSLDPAQQTCLMAIAPSP